MLKNFNWGDNPDGTRYFIVCAIFQVVTAIAVLLRCYSRQATKQTFQVNDYAIFASLVRTSYFVLNVKLANVLATQTLSIANMAILGLCMASAHPSGIRGLHIHSCIDRLGLAHSTITPREYCTVSQGKKCTTQRKTMLLTQWKLQITLSVIWAWNLFTIKIAILDIYMKIFWVEKNFIKVCWAYLILQCCWVIAAMLQNLLWCIPIAYTWDKSIAGGKCGDLYKSYYSGHIIIFVLDFFLAVMPIPVLWKLKMDVRKKIGIGIMFAIVVA